MRQALAAGLEQVVGILHEQRDYEAAIPYAQRWLALDTLHEPTHRHLMHLYAQSGQYRAALRQYERCLQTLADELDVEPAAETTTLYQQIRNHKRNSEAPTQHFAHRSVMPRHNLPVQTTPFIGRADELADLSHLLRESSIHLVTILGPGGIGKTRFAIQAARHLEKQQEHVYFAALAPVQTAEELIAAIASALRFTIHPDKRSVKEQLFDYLRQKEILLVLDNVEHLLDHIELINELLEAAPEVKVLATSRERLQLSGETVFVLNGMACQGWQSVEDALTYDAVQLFCQGAQRVQPDYLLIADDLVHIAQICTLVGGMPLGILLATAWVELLSPQEIAEEISQSLDILTTELRDVPERQRSLRAVFEHAWQRLGKDERIVLMRLTVFQGGFTYQAAHSVAGASLPTLRLLVEKSLLYRTTNARYTLHELLRHYAANKLAQETPHEDRVCYRHSRFYAHLLAHHVDELRIVCYPVTQVPLAADFENVRVAWNWALQQRHLDNLAGMVEGLGLFYQRLTRYQEGVSAFQTVIARLEAASDDYTKDARWHIILAQAHLHLGALHYRMGARDRARVALAKSLRLLASPALATVDCRSIRAAALNALGNTQYGHVARISYEQSLTLCCTTDNKWQEAQTRLGFGKAILYYMLGTFEEAKRQILNALDIYRKLNDLQGVAEALFRLAIVHLYTRLWQQN